MTDPAVHAPSLMRSEGHGTPRYTIPNHYMARSASMALIQPSIAKCSRRPTAKKEGGSPKKVTLAAILRK